MLGVVVGLLLVSGCGSSGETPGALPSRSTAPSPSAPSSAAATAEASGAATPEAQIEASIRRYYAAYDDAANSGDVAPLKAVSVPECECRKAIDTMAATFAPGRVAKGYATTITSVTNVRPDSKFSDAQVAYRVAAYDFVDERGAVVQHFDSAETVVNVTVDNSRGYLVLLIQRAK